MKRWLALVCGMLMAAGPGQALAKPSLLIVGTPHFANPGNDTLKSQVPSVLTPERQAEIERIVDRLAAFRPTHVAVEWPSEKQAELNARYADYRAGRHELAANERDQIGLRLAARLSLPRVDAVDSGSEMPGERSDYHYPNWAEANGRGEEWRAWVDKGQKEADAEDRLKACTPVSSWLRKLNAPEGREQDHRAYFFIAQIGELTGPNPGAAWVGSWYTRNLRILNNLRAIAPEPDDRVVAIYGAGHGYLLDQQARESGDFEVADTMAYLPESPRDEWTQCPG